MPPVPTYDDVRAAAVRIAPYAHRTPVLTCATLNRMADASLFFKCENLQKVGAFKFRGACNAVFSLSDDQAKLGVATHSSGNHAAALSLAARLRGIPAHIVMPRTAKAVKKVAVEGYGGRITFCEPTLAARESTLAQVVAETGATEIHPYNHPLIIAGQGTAALELLGEIPDLDVLITPVGGGGLLAGTGLAASGHSPMPIVLAGEPKGADDAARSLATGAIVPSVNPRTIADGLLTSLGELNFAIIRQHVSRIITVSEEEITAAMRLVWERMKIIIEPSSAVAVAAVVQDAQALRHQRIGIILSGGNVDLGDLPWNTSKTE